VAPDWLHALAVSSLLVAALSAVVIAVHIWSGHPQHMWIMNLVWPLSGHGWMALVAFVWLGELPKTDPVFWFMMQIAMLAGFVTSYPVHIWLIRSGLKEAM
jgi:hypothetical protein